MNTQYRFNPVANNESKVLILGSFPSVKSREIKFYYGNKQNRFWKVLEEYFGEKVPENTDGKRAFLLAHHIALWDIVASSTIKGSSDNELIKKIDSVNDIPKLLQDFPTIQAVICNGKASYSLTTKFFPNISAIYLPSTSPANVSFKKEAWFKAFKNLNL